MMKKYLFAMLCAVCCALTAKAGIPPSIHVEGRDLVDTHGNKVVLHGVMDTPSQWFNSGRWGWGGYDASDAPSKCLAYFEKVFTALTDTAQGAYCNVFRLHLDPCWTNGSGTAKGFTKKDGKWYDPNGQEVGGEADIHAFDMTRFKKFWSSVYWKLAEKAMNHGMHVVMRPPGVCPGTIKVGDYYQQYLIDVWSHVASQANTKKYAGQVSIELANEPVRITNADGTQTANTMHDYFQPVVDAIRAQGFTGIIWVPGGTWQQDYRGYATYPIEGYNIGYAAHAYVGWYGGGDNNTGENFLRCFLDGVPVVKTNPVIITEIDWSPESEADGHYNESGTWVNGNFGTWATGTTKGWGSAFKYAKDQLGNVSMTLSGTDCLIDMQHYLDTKEVIPAFTTKMTKAGLDPYQGCGAACMQWYAEYAKENRPKADFANLSTNLNAAQTKFLNPILAADFPDPDVARLGDTYYMLSTTFQLQPGATVLKSKDLVNWQYCANPLQQLSGNDKYSLLNGQNAYAGGMWAGAIEEHDGKLYILINGNDAGAFVLSTDNPEGLWDVKKLDRGYYDPGMIMEGDKIYVACGINHISICELDKNWKFIRDAKVIQKDDAGLEGCHLYHIGEYYYIYATYGGWPTAQTIFRSKNVMGPYEEHDGMLFDKFINNAPNTVHQGALVQTDMGDWWTMLMEDKGAIGRLPSLHPVTWADGWPTLGKKGVPQLTYDRPKFKQYAPVEVPETNDNFRTFQLGKQWQWNHNNPKGSWSLLERPGYLRLRTSSVVDDLMQARGTLTQRIFAYHATSGGLNTSKFSLATIALDVANMQEGDMAGIAVQQDPYAMLAVTKKADGSYALVWKNGSHTGTDGYTPGEESEDVEPVDGVIYLRARFAASSGKASFQYSTDNATWKTIGQETQLKFNLSVFLGARWAMFNYATKEMGGYVDIDWFSTEEKYDEGMFFPAEFNSFNEDMLTATSLAATKEHIDIMIGAGSLIELIATYADGHTEDVAQQARYTCSWPDLISVSNGRIIGKCEGEGTVTATYTDPMGNTHTVEFTVSASYFPFSAQCIKTNIYGNGTYKEDKRIFRPSQWGQMGWEYSQPVDMSGYKYLVLLLDKTQNCEADLRLYTDASIWSGDCYIKKIGTLKKVIINMQTIKYTDGDKKGQEVDTEHIYKVVFWSNGNGDIDVKDLYLTNNEDKSREDHTGIDELEADTEVHLQPTGVYGLDGRKMAPQNLRKGIYIIDGRKVVVK